MSISVVRVETPNRSADCPSPPSLFLLCFVDLAPGSGSAEVQPTVMGGEGPVSHPSRSPSPRSWLCLDLGVP